MIIGKTLIDISALENGFVVENCCRLASGTKTFFDTWADVLDYLDTVGEIEGLHDDDERDQCCTCDEDVPSE